MADITSPASAAQNTPHSTYSADHFIDQAQMATITYDGHTFHLMTFVLMAVFFGLLFLFYRIQRSNKLDFADMLTKDGRSVSLTKVLQLIGGVTSTWIMIKLTLQGGLTEALFGLYLAYVAGVEGYSKYVAAKYGYTETSVKDAQPDPDPAPAPPAPAQPTPAPVPAVPRPAPVAPASRPVASLGSALGSAGPMPRTTE